MSITYHCLIHFVHFVYAIWYGASVRVRNEHIGPLGFYDGPTQAVPDAIGVPLRRCLMPLVGRRRIATSSRSGPY